MAAPLSLLAPALRVTPTADGTILEPIAPLPPPAPTVLAWLDAWAAAAPTRTLFAERDRAGAWQRLSYGAAHAAVAGVATALVERGAGPGAPVLVLSDNSIGHALVALAAMHVGAPVVPVSTAYALASTTFARLRYVVGVVAPAVVYAEDHGPYAAALAAVGLPPARCLDAAA